MATSEEAEKVVGAVFEADGPGFIEMLQRVNEARLSGKILLTVVHLKGGKLGAIFVPKQHTIGNSFFE